jgi:hypothetical protein
VGLSKYPLVVIGSSIGGVLTYNISNATHGAIPMLNINEKKDTYSYVVRPFFEQKRINLSDYRKSRTY